MNKKFQYNYSDHEHPPHIWETAREDLQDCLMPEDMEAIDLYFEGRRETVVKEFDAKKEVQEVIDYELEVGEVSQDWQHMGGRGNVLHISYNYCKSKRAQEVGKCDTTKMVKLDDKMGKEEVAAYVSQDTWERTMLEGWEIMAHENKLNFSERKLLYPAYTLFVPTMLNVTFVGKDAINLARPVTVAGILDIKFPNLQPSTGHPTCGSGHSAVGFAMKKFWEEIASKVLGREIKVSEDFKQWCEEVGTGRFSLRHHFIRDHEESRLATEQFWAMIWNHVRSTLLM